MKPLPFASLACGLVLLSCSSPAPPVDPQLRQAMASVRYMTGHRFLSQSAFAGTDPNAKPSDFVTYIFSDFGVPEWPIALDDFERDQLKAAGIPALPEGVALVPMRADPSIGLQVVLRADDAAGLVIAEAYEDPAAEPVLVLERRLLP